MFSRLCSGVSPLRLVLGRGINTSFVSLQQRCEQEIEISHFLLSWNENQVCDSASEECPDLCLGRELLVGPEGRMCFHECF